MSAKVYFGQPKRLAMPKHHSREIDRGMAGAMMQQIGRSEGKTRKCYVYRVIITRQGRGSEATEAVFCLQAKKPLHSGSYEHA